MNRISFFIFTTLLALVCISCDTNLIPAQSPLEKMAPAQTTALSDSLKTVYSNFATALAIDTLVNNADTKYSQVEISDQLKQFYFYALVHVYNFKHAARDSVVNKYSVNTRPLFVPTDVIVRVDAARALLNNWRKNKFETGNAKLDKLLTAYQISAIKINEHIIGSSLIAVLTFKQPLNAYALADQLYKTGEFVYAEPNGYSGDGNRIKTNVTNDFIDLDYGLGFGDCPAGCIARHWWTFRVHYDGIVEYYGSRGDPVYIKP